VTAFPDGWSKVITPLAEKQVERLQRRVGGGRTTDASASR